jgi:hypothetical protein
MRNPYPLLVCAAAVSLLYAADPKTIPEYTSDERLKFPEHYREWIYLSSGIGMTYGPLGPQTQNGPQFFDNIFVNPEAYHSFLQTGRWPDKTILVMEARQAESHASINNGGHFQRSRAAIPPWANRNGGANPNHRPHPKSRPSRSLTPTTA